MEKLRECIYDAHEARAAAAADSRAGWRTKTCTGSCEAYGECEKVVKQPPPGCIITHLKSTLMVYVCTLPFILSARGGQSFAVVPTTALPSAWRCSARKPPRSRSSSRSGTGRTTSRCAA